jgi:acyl-CoA reductase-like NAD-dependent aldehyde dehydrogenase
LSGLIPETETPDSLSLVFKDPLGIVLGIAPWNAPAMLGMRSIAAAVAAGNCAILKVILIPVYTIVNNSHTDFVN